MNLITILLVDKDPDSLNCIKKFIQELNGFQIIGQCETGEQLVEEAISKNPDLILTATKMPEKNGIAALKEIHKQFPNTKVIFITNYDEFALDAFEIAAVDYIVKPVDRIRLFKALEKAKKLISYEKSKQAAYFLDSKILPLKNGNSTILIPLNDINFIEKAGRKCLVYTDQDIYETAEPITRILPYMDDHFFYGHRSYIINTLKISKVTPHKESFIVQFHNGEHLAKVSKLKINELKGRTSF